MTVKIKELSTCKMITFSDLSIGSFFQFPDFNLIYQKLILNCSTDIGYLNVITGTVYFYINKSAPIYPLDVELLFEKQRKHEK